MPGIKAQRGQIYHKTEVISIGYSTEVEVTDRLIEALLLTMKHEGPRVIENPDQPKDYDKYVGIENRVWWHSKEQEKD